LLSADRLLSAAAAVRCLIARIATDRCACRCCSHEGLRSLAEAELGDLPASVCAPAALPPYGWFAAVRLLLALTQVPLMPQSTLPLAC
jgi:hypothetical protein